MVQIQIYMASDTYHHERINEAIIQEKICKGFNAMQRLISLIVILLMLKIQRAAMANNRERVNIRPITFDFITPSI